MRVSIIGAASLAAVLSAGCAGGDDDEKAAFCAAGKSEACEADGGRPGTRTCADTGDEFGPCIAAPCGAVPLAVSGVMHTSGSSISLGGAPTSTVLEFVPPASAGSPSCLGHAVLSAGSGCTLDLELSVADVPYGGLRSIVLWVGPECPGFTAAQEGLYASPPGWAPDWWLGPREVASSAACVADAEFTFADRILRLMRADGVFLDVNLRDVSFAGDFRVDVSTSPFLQCIVPSCSPGMADGGAGWCVPYGTCVRGYHDGGAGTCILEGTCTRGYGLATDGSCVVWEQTGDMVQERSDAVAFRLPDGDVLVTGGYTPGSGPHDPIRSDRYRPATGTWSETGKPRFKHEGGAYAQLPDGRVLAIGGFDSYREGVYDPGGTRVAEVFDPATGQWSEVAPMITRRYDHTATTLANGRVLVTGGSSVVSTDLASAEIYDPNVNTWQAAGTMAVPRSRHGAALLPNGGVLVAGGLGTPTTSTEIWRPSGPISPGFTAGPAIDLGYYPTLTPLGDGRFVVTKYLEGTVAVLDPATMQLRGITSFPNTSRVLVAPLLDGHVLAIGAEGAALLDVDEPLVISVPVPPRAHGSGTATRLADGTVLVAGGGPTYRTADVYVGEW